MNCWHANYQLQTIQIQLPSCFCLINVGTLVILHGNAVALLLQMY